MRESISSQHNHALDSLGYGTAHNLKRPQLEMGKRGNQVRHWNVVFKSHWISPPWVTTTIFAAPFSMAASRNTVHTRNALSYRAEDDSASGMASQLWAMKAAQSGGSSFFTSPQVFPVQIPRLISMRPSMTIGLGRPVSSAIISAVSIARPWGDVKSRVSPGAEPERAFFSILPLASD